MKLYIQVQNEQTVNHPALEENLIQAFGSIPSNWEPFERIERPTIGIYQVLENENPTYQKIDGIWKDVWSIREMTQEEKDAVDEKQRKINAALNEKPTLVSTLP